MPSRSTARPHVCFDRVLPRELFRPQPTQPGRPGRTRALSPIGKTWMNGSTLHTRFLGGSAAQRDVAIAQARWWTDLCNLQIVFDARPGAEDDDSGYAFNARIAADPSAGDTRVQVRHCNRESGFGDYSVKVRRA